MKLTPSEIEALRVMLRTWVEPTPEATEFVREQLMALCDTALEHAAPEYDYSDCDHLWRGDTCEKCGAKS